MYRFKTRYILFIMISMSAFKALPEIPGLAEEAEFGLEFTGLIDPIQYPEDFISGIRSLSHFRLFRSAHGPFYDLIPGSSDPEVAGLAKMKFIRALDACAKLDIKHIVFHSGWTANFYPDDVWIKNSVSFWLSLMESIGDDVAIYLENVNDPKPYLIKDIVDGVHDKRMKVCLDVGHVNVLGKEDPLQWIEILGNRIGHVHLHNNYGVYDEHNGLSGGTLDIPMILKYLKINCPLASWNLEIRRGLEESIEMVKNT